MKSRVPDIRPKLSRSDARLLLDATFRDGARFWEWADNPSGWHIKAARRLERRGLVTVSEPQPSRHYDRDTLDFVVLATADGLRRMLGGKAPS